MEQPSFKLENGGTTRPDFAVVDESGNIKSVNEAKTGNSKLSSGQSELQKSGGTLTGKKYRRFNGATVNPGSLVERRVGNEELSNWWSNLY